MNELTLGTQGDRRGFLPGQEVAGGAAWRLDGIPREVEVCLFWFTRGKGTEDVVVVDTVRLDSPSREDRRDFRFTLPEGPYSFSGRLISLTWALELVTRRRGRPTGSRSPCLPQAKRYPSGWPTGKRREPMRARDNPFRTECLHRVGYRLRGTTWADLMARLRQLSNRAAIVGPEGSGKTTLLAELADRLGNDGFRVRSHRLGGGGVPGELWEGLRGRDAVLLDGADVLGRLAWRRFTRRTQGAGAVIVTSHRAGLLPTLHTCATTPQLLGELVEDLTAGHAPVAPGTVEALFREHRGDLRLALRELYDVYAGR